MVKKLDLTAETDTNAPVDRAILVQAVNDWLQGHKEPALDIYAQHGIEAFRNLPERFWKVSNEWKNTNGKVILHRSVRQGEINEGPVIMDGKDPQRRIQRLTTWRWSVQFPHELEREGGKLLSFEADQEDIAFAPMTNAPHVQIKSHEVVVADYHLKKNKLVGLNTDDAAGDDVITADQNKPA